MLECANRAQYELTCSCFAGHPGRGIAVAYAVLGSATQDTYNRVLRELPQPPSCRVMCDFEAALRNAVKQAWPAAHLGGCIFHLKRVSVLLQTGAAGRRLPNRIVALRVLT